PPHPPPPPPRLDLLTRARRLRDCLLDPSVAPRREHERTATAHGAADRRRVRTLRSRDGCHGGSRLQLDGQGRGRHGERADDSGAADRSPPPVDRRTAIIRPPAASFRPFDSLRAVPSPVEGRVKPAGTPAPS